MDRSEGNALKKGSVIHNYILEDELGFGSFGVTYQVKHTILGTLHAIKEYLPSDIAIRGSDSGVYPKSRKDKDNYEFGLERFFDEARILHTLAHPNVVRVTDIFQANNTAYFVMPFLKGKTLLDWLQQHKNPTQEELEDIFMPLLEGLKYIHGKDLLHRDIKPANIFICENGTPQLIDFGAARFATGIRSRPITVILTPRYAPYEQYYSTSVLTPAVDIYSLGACIYTALADEPPLEAPERIPEDKQAQLAQSPLKKKYDGNFLAAVDKAMAVLAKDRFQDAFSFQKALMGKAGKAKDQIQAPSPPPSLPKNDYMRFDAAGVPKIGGFLYFLAFTLIANTVIGFLGALASDGLEQLFFFISGFMFLGSLVLFFKKKKMFKNVFLCLIGLDLIYAIYSFLSLNLNLSPGETVGLLLKDVGLIVYMLRSERVRRTFIL